MDQSSAVIDSAILDLVTDFDHLAASGELDRRDTNLLAVIGLSRTELVHSQVVRWLLDPSASHGLGASLLSDLLGEGWEHVSIDGLDKAVVTTEQTHLETR